MRLQEETDRYNSIYIPLYQAHMRDLTPSRDPTYDQLDQCLEYLSCMVTIDADPQLSIRCVPECFMMARQLFVLGAVRSGCLNSVQANRMGDALMQGVLPRHTDVYQFLAYILRLEEHHCGIDTTIMLPALALYNSVPLADDVKISLRTLGVIQSFSVLDGRYPRKTLVSRDPMRYVSRLQGMITSVSAETLLEGDPYLEYMLACIKNVIIPYLMCLVQRTSKSSVFKKQADLVLTAMLKKHRTVVNTDYVRQCM